MLSSFGTGAACYDVARIQKCVPPPQLCQCVPSIQKYGSLLQHHCIPMWALLDISLGCTLSICALVRTVAMFVRVSGARVWALFMSSSTTKNQRRPRIQRSESVVVRCWGREVILHTLRQDKYTAEGSYTPSSVIGSNTAAKGAPLGVAAQFGSCNVDRVL